MPSFLTKLKTTKEPSSPRYIPPPLECPKCTFTTHTRITLKKHIESQHSPNSPKLVKCPKCTFTTHTRSKLKKHIESQHSPNYAPKTPELVKCPYCKDKVPDLNNHVQSLHPVQHEEELRRGYRPPASPSKGGKRSTHYKSRSNRKTKRKSRTRK